MWIQLLFSHRLLLINRIKPSSIFQVLGDDLQSSTEGSSSENNDENSNIEQGNSDGNTIDEIENNDNVENEPEVKQIKTTEKPNSDFEGTKVLPNGMEARKGNELLVL